MTRAVEWVLRAAAAALAGALLLNLLGGWSGSRAAPSGPAGWDRHFHDGKSAAAPEDESGCRSPGCHPPHPHSKDAATSAFANMHQRHVSCLACHGRQARERWTAGRDRSGRGVAIGYVPASGPAGQDRDPHSGLGGAVRCRECHSAAGVAALSAKGIAGLAPGFTDPVPLRMIERGGMRWIPADLR